MKEKNVKSSPDKTQQGKKSKLPVILIVALAVLLAALVIVRLPDSIFNDSTATAEPVATSFAMPTPEPTATPAPTAEVVGPEIRYGIEVPYELEDGKLTITSFFTMDMGAIGNPDAGGAYGSNIAAVAVENTSEEFLKSLTLSIDTADGVTLNFTAQDVPAGRTVWMFETANQSVNDQTVEYVDLRETASFEAAATLREDDFTIEAEGTKVTLTNNSGSAWANLAIDFHTLFAGEENVYFGGKTVTYTVRSIGLNETQTFDVYDCKLGTAEAVRVRQGT